MSVFDDNQPPNVPKVDLLDPSVEPTDEEMDALLESVAFGVKRRAEKARLMLIKDLHKKINSSLKRLDSIT
jgi:hypothetical protein